MALSTARSTKRRQGDVYAYPVKAGVICYQGGLAVLNGGYAAPGSTATGLVAIGMFEETVDNTAGQSGDVVVQVREGIFLFDNSASTDLIAQAQAGADCYIVDDQAVAKTTATNTRSRAGKIIAVETGGVWVKIGHGV